MKIGLWFGWGLLVALAGCASTRTSDTARTGLEQMLVSNAIDQAMEGTQFNSVYDKSVFVQDKYLDCTDKPYIVGSLRHRVLEAGGRLVDDVANADVVMEIRSGGVGTDNSDRYVGMPGLAVPGLPLEIPEVRLWEKKSQFGTAKLAIAVFDARNGQHLESGGQLARSDNSRISVLGFTTGDNGSVNRELASSHPHRLPASNYVEAKAEEMIAEQPRHFR